MKLLNFMNTDQLDLVKNIILVFFVDSSLVFFVDSSKE